MADSILPVKTATSETVNLRVKDDGIVGLSPYHVEDATQRAALIQALVAITNAVTLGASTSGDGAEAILQNILAALVGTLQVSATALPLPTNAATNATVAEVRDRLDEALSVVVSGTVPLPTGAATEVTLLAIKAVLEAAQSVSVTASVLPTGAATQARQSEVLDLLGTKTFPVSVANLPLPANALTQDKGEEIRALAEALNALVGTTNSAAAAGDTGTANINARLQRIAQRLTNVADRLPLTLGAKTEALSLSITPSTDQDPIFDPANATLVAATNATTLLINPPAGCKYIRVFSDGLIYINTVNGAAANNAAAIVIPANTPEIIPVTPGVIVNVLAATTANVRAMPMKAR